MAALLPSSSHFALGFGPAAWKGVEYSISDDAGRHAVTVAGHAALIGRVQAFASSLPFGAAWAWAIGRYAEQVRPDAYLFRVDWQGELPLAATLYCRFPVEPTATAFATAMRAAHPITWKGPDPAAVATALGVCGPRGVGLRVIATGSCSAAVYFRVPDIRSTDARQVVTGLIEALRLPAHLADDVEGDLRGLSSSSGGVVGVGIDEEGSSSLKLNPPNVDMGRAFEFLREKGAPPERIGAINRLAVSLRASSLSYLGIRYGAGGFTGWRAYLSLETYRIVAPLQPRVTLERGALPTLRLPHD